MTGDATEAREEWRLIAEFPDYAVSNLGRVRRVVADPLGRLRKAVRTGTVTSHGYLQVALWRDGVPYSAMVHRLVCAAFHGAPTADRRAVAHNDGNPLNNRSSNLRWASAIENERDKRRHGTVACGERSGTSKLTESDIRAIRADRRPQRTIAADYGVTQANISAIVLKKTWGHVA